MFRRKGKEQVPVTQNENRDLRLRGQGTLGGYGQGAQGGYGSSPFALMRQMMEDMDRLFTPFAGGSILGPSLYETLPTRSAEALGPLGQAGWSPQIEMFEKDGNLVVRADLPGLDRNDIRVNVDDDVLTISGERRGEHEEKREGYFHSERAYGTFQRAIQLPRGADASSCDASFDNGVLEIKMKMPKSSARTVQIRGGSQATSKQPAQGQATPPMQPVQNGPAATR